MFVRTMTVAGVIVGALAVATPAPAQSPPAVIGPYDGSIPFRCQLQDVGTGTDFPDPDADPFCVEFDKTSQNLTEFGLVEFASREPARVAAASSKCFYFQRDHWTGSIVQGAEPELWHWDGDYWFDRARGTGGVSVRNFRLAGSPLSAAPYVPPAYRPYFDQAGGGGVEVLLETNPDPACAARVDTPEERDQVYADRAIESRCIDPGGGIRGLRIGKAKLRRERSAIRRRLGPPTYALGRVDAWCLVGKGELRAAYGRGARTQALVTSGSGQALRGVSRGDRLRRARRALALEPGSAFKVGGVRAYSAPRQHGRRVWVGAARDRVRWLLLAKPRYSLTESTRGKLLRRLP